MNKETAPYDALIDIGKKRALADVLEHVEERIKANPGGHYDEARREELELLKDWLTKQIDAT